MKNRSKSWGGAKRFVLAWFVACIMAAQCSPTFAIVEPPEDVVCILRIYMLDSIGDTIWLGEPGLSDDPRCPHNMTG